MGRHREFDVDETLDRALEVFWRNGYEGASFDDLCRATGVARPGLYRAFGNKESLFFKAVERFEASFMGYVEEALAMPTSLEVVRAIWLGSAAVQTADPAHPGCITVNGAMACSDDAEPIRRRLIERRAAMEAVLARRLDAARASGDLPASADAAVLAAFVMTVVHGMAVQAKAGAPRQMLEAIAAQALMVWPSTDRQVLR